MTDTHAPGWHYAEAERLLAKAAESNPIDEAAFIAAVTARAQGHALLAAVPPSVANGHTSFPLPRRENAHTPF